METVAGSTAEAANNGNEWLPEYEGLRAFDANEPGAGPHLSEPHMAMDDARGNIYIADKNGHGIRRVTRDRRLITVAGRAVVGGVLTDDGDGPATERLVAYPNGLFVLPDGTFYILEQGLVGLPPRIRRVGLDGMLTTLVTGEGAGTVFNRGLWVARDQSLIYFCAIENGVGLVKRWTPSGGVGTVATMPAGSEPGNLDVDSDGTIAMADRGLHRVYRIDPNSGGLTVIAGNGGATGGGDGQSALTTGLEEVRGVAFHPFGGYFLCTHRGGDVWFVDAAGTIHKLIEGNRNSTVREGDGLPVTSDMTSVKISEPRSVRVGYSGDLLLATNDCGWIRVVRGSLPAPPVGLTLTFEPEPTLEFEAIAGLDYFLQRNPGLDPRGWRTISALTPASGGVVSPTDPAPVGAGPVFYRLTAARHWP
jgi:hypothetical protein